MSARKRVNKATAKALRAKKASTRQKTAPRKKAVKPTKHASAKTMRPKKSDWATAIPIDLEDHLANVAESQLLGGAPKGACLVTDPNTGSARCTLTTKDFCQKTLKGVFVGGPCGG